MSAHREHLIPRDRGEDKIVQVRLRRANWDALISSEGMEVHGRMRLVADVDGVTTILVWTGEMPQWPDAVPGSEEAAAERERQTAAGEGRGHG